MVNASLAIAFVLLPLLTMTIGQQDATTIGSFCTQDSDCLGGGIICKTPISNCTYGECGCPDYQTFDIVALQCKNSTVVGMPCDTTMACKQLNSQCIDGTCACIEGYIKKRSPDGIMFICTPKTAIGKFGTTCFDTNECMAPLICSASGLCTCDIGYSYTANPKRLCAPKSVDDACTADDECLVANAYCTDGTCQCAGGYKNFPWRLQFREPLTGTYTAWTISACVGFDEPLYNPGSQCLTALRRSVSTACNSNSICIPCNPHVNNTGYCAELQQSVGFLGGYTGIARSPGST